MSCDPLGKDSAPVIRVTTSDAQISAGAAGGACSFGFEVQNPVSGSLVMLEVPEGNDWITEPVIEFDGKIGSVTLTLAENIDMDTRNEILTLRYLYGSGEEVTSAVSILQEGKEYDYVVECTSGISFYYGSGMLDSKNLFSYYLRLADCDLNAEERVNASVYSFDLYYKKRTEDKLPPAGTYIMVPEGSETDFCFTDANTLYEHYGEDDVNFSDYEQSYFTEGAVRIVRDGDTYKIICALVDTEGKSHLVRYTGELSLTDMTALSTLKGDIELDITGYEAVLECYAGYFGTGLNKWVFKALPADIKEGDMFISLELLTSVTLDSEAGITAPLTIESSNSTNPDVAVYFMPGQYGYLLSWLMTCGSYDDSTGEIEATAPSAPFVNGVIYLEPDEDGTMDFSADVTDDVGHSMKISGSGLTVKYIDML